MLVHCCTFICINPNTVAWRQTTGIIFTDFHFPQYEMLPHNTETIIHYRLCNASTPYVFKVTVNRGSFYHQVHVGYVHASGHDADRETDDNVDHGFYDVEFCL